MPEPAIIIKLLSDPLKISLTMHSWTAKGQKTTNLHLQWIMAILRVETPQLKGCSDRKWQKLKDRSSIFTRKRILVHISRLRFQRLPARDTPKPQPQINDPITVNTPALSKDWATFRTERRRGTFPSMVRNPLLSSPIKITEQLMETAQKDLHKTAPAFLTRFWSKPPKQASKIVPSSTGQRKFLRKIHFLLQANCKASSTTVNTTRTSIALTASKRKSRLYWTRSRDDHLFLLIVVLNIIFVNFIHPSQNHTFIQWLIPIKRKRWVRGEWFLDWVLTSRAHPVTKRQVGATDSFMIIMTSTMKPIPIA